MSKSGIKNETIDKLPWALSVFHVLCMLGVLIAWHPAIRDWGADTAWTVAQRMSFGVYWFCEKLLFFLHSSTSPHLHGVLDVIGIQSVGDLFIRFLWPLLLILGTFQWVLVGLGIVWLVKRTPAGLISNLSRSFEKYPFLQRLLGQRVQPRLFLLIVGALPFLWLTLTAPRPPWALCLIITLGFILQRYCPSLLGWLLLTVIHLLVTSFYLMILTDDLLDLMANKPTWYFPVTESFLYFMGGFVYSVAIAAGLLFSKPYSKTA